ncbi:MAG: PorT family protein [Bacteroidota bacterium]|nr:MAG: PorT family protein [Bacteroidota bacterium]
MKNKFLLLIPFMLGFFMVLKAQNPYFGVKAGFNLSHMSIKNDDGDQLEGLNLAPGFNLGGTMDYRLMPELTINASLVLTTKGYRKRYSEEFQGVTIDSRERLTLYYIELPVYALYEFDFVGLDMIAGLGPFVSYGYWGKYSWKREGGGEEETGKEDVYWGTNPDTDDLVPFDYGAGIKVGGKYENFVLDVSYLYSIPNIAADIQYGRVVRNSVFSASVSYFFSMFYPYDEANF